MSDHPADAAEPAPATGEPGVQRPEAQVVWQLTQQGLACAVMDAPLSAFLLHTAAADVLEGGPCADLLMHDVRPGRGDAYGLRLLAALHRLVLDRRAPRLALHYPSVGGTPGLRGVREALCATVAEHLDGDLRDLVAMPCQTNEPGRAAGLLVGLLDVAATTGLSLRLREVGASAGLNLRLDHFAYEIPRPDGRGTHRLGPDDAEVVLADRWTAPPPGDPPQMFDVVDRRGCDPAPIDITTVDGRARISSSVWCDQPDRFALLGAAVRTAQRVPATVDVASAAGWAADQLADESPGACRVVFHSIVREYLSADEQIAMDEAIVAAGERATDVAPVAHVAFEPDTTSRRVAVTVRVWPHAPNRRVVATCGAHGTDVTPGAPADAGRGYSP